MTTFGDFKDQIGRLLEDSGGLLSDDLMLDATSGALVAILPWHSKASSHVFTSGSAGETNVFALPSDFYSADGLLDLQSDKLLPSSKLVPGVYLGDDIEGQKWLIYPYGYLSIWPEPDDGDQFTLYYQATWAVPTTDNSVLELPSYLIPAAAFWAGAYCLGPEAVSTSEIRQYGTRADSGTPAHNPVADRVMFLLKLFENEIKRHPRGIRGELI